MNQHTEARPVAAEPGFERLKQRIDQRLATVAVMGLGYVGLPLALRLTRAGFPVLGFDIDPRKCEQLERGESYLSHIAGADLAGLRQGKFRATADAADLAAAEIFVICVPTPLSAKREPDLQYVVATVESLNDSRETPAAEILSQLKELGDEVSYSDPFVPVFPAMRKHDFDLTSQEITAGTLREQDCVVLVTDHDAFDYELIGQTAPLVVDTRGRFRPRTANVVSA